MPGVLSVVSGTKTISLPLEICLHVLTHADVDVLLRLRGLNAILRFGCDQILKTRLHSHVSPFADDVPGFFELLASSRSIVSGSLALSFLHSPSTAWTSSDMDLYTPDSSYSAVVQTMQDKYGYERDKDFTLRRYYGYDIIHRVTKLRHPSKLVSVDVISPSNDCAASAIFAFYGTHLLNWISGHGFYSAYPGLTFQSLSIVDPILMEHTHSNMLAALQKYQTRGFRFLCDYRVVEDEAGCAPHVCEEDPRCSLSV